MTLYNVVFTAYANDDDSNPFVNAFQYDVDDVLPSSAVAQSLAQQFSDEVIIAAGGWVDVVQFGMDTESVVVTSPFDPTVLGIELPVEPGTRPGAQMPRFVAWGFKSERTRADIRAGFKRFGLISETDTAGQVPSVDALAMLNGFATVLNQTLTVSDGVSSFNARPIIVKRVKYVTADGKDAYRLPNSPLEYQYMFANWKFQAITTQSSRKR